MAQVVLSCSPDVLWVFFCLSTFQLGLLFCYSMIHFTYLSMIAILLPLNCHMVPVCNFQWVTAGFYLLQLPLIYTRNTNTCESFITYCLSLSILNIHLILCTVSLYCPYFTLRCHFLLLVKRGKSNILYKVVGIRKKVTPLKYPLPPSLQFT